MSHPLPVLALSLITAWLVAPASPAKAISSTELKTGISNSLAVIMMFGFILGIFAVIYGGFAIRRGDVDQGKMSIRGGFGVAYQSGIFNPLYAVDLLEEEGFWATPAEQLLARAHLLLRVLLARIDIGLHTRQMTIAGSRSIAYTLDIYSIQTFPESAFVTGRYQIVQAFKKRGRTVLKGDIQWNLIRENGSLKIREIDYGRAP
jgi:hypothetical protein